MRERDSNDCRSLDGIDGSISEYHQIEDRELTLTVKLGANSAPGSPILSAPIGCYVRLDKRICRCDDIPPWCDDLGTSNNSLTR